MFGFECLVRLECPGSGRNCLSSGRLEIVHSSRQLLLLRLLRALQLTHAASQACNIRGICARTMRRLRFLKLRLGSCNRALGVCSDGIHVCSKRRQVGGVNARHHLSHGRRQSRKSVRFAPARLLQLFAACICHLCLTHGRVGGVESRDVTCHVANNSHGRYRRRRRSCGNGSVRYALTQHGHHFL